MSHTYALMSVSEAVFDEVAEKLREAGYDHAFVRDGVVDTKGVIDMHGIALFCHCKPEKGAADGHKS